MHLHFPSWNKRGKVWKKTRIRFNSDIPVVIFKAPYIHEHDTLILPETLMIEGGKVSWLYSLEELFILQNIADLIKSN